MVCVIILYNVRTMTQSPKDAGDGGIEQKKRNKSWTWTIVW